MKKVNILLLFFCFFVIDNSLAQERKCEEVLSGLYDYKTKSFDTEFWRRYIREIDEKKFNSLERFKEHNKSLGVTIPIKQLPVSFSFGNAGKVNTATKSYNSFSEFIEDNIEFKSSFKEVFKTVNEAVVNAWIDCKKSERFITWITINGEFLSLHMQRGKFDEPAYLKLNTIQFSKESLEIVGRDKYYFGGLVKWGTTKDFKGLVIGGSPKVITFKITDRSKPSFIDITTNNNNYTANHQIRAILPDRPQTVKAKPIEICLCTGKGGLAGQKYWGPKGEPCCGIPDWGVYSEDCRKVTELYKATGEGGLSAVTFWGPKGEHVAGIKSWAKFGGNPVKVSSVEAPNYLSYCYCEGSGSLLNGISFWGPKGEPCGGITRWGLFRFGCLNK